MEISNIVTYVQNGALYGALAAFLVVSYLLYALFNWSFVKPLKSIGICSIIVGILLLVVRFGNKIVLSLIDFNIPSSVVGAILKPFLVMGIILVLVGILLIVLKHTICKKLEEKNEKNIVKKIVKKTTKKTSKKK